jgi:transcriptional regulator with XRE-family HTH domain
MGKYRLGDIVSMTRKSLGLTQEELSDGICSVETLSRIENGKHLPNRNLYELLMERMGRNRERSYSVIPISEYDTLENIKLFEYYIDLYNYSQAELVLKKIKEKSKNTILNIQFITRAEYIIDFRLKRINAKVFLHGLEKAIRLTIPKNNYITYSNWPLNFQEAVLMLNLSSAYAQNDNYNKAIEILLETNKLLEKSYMDVKQRITLQITLLNNLAKWYGIIGENNKAIDAAQKGILFCRDFKLGNILPNLIYTIVWNEEILIEKGIFPQDYSKQCLAKLKQAYYIACAMNQSFIEQFILKHIKSYFKNQN